VDFEAVIKRIVERQEVTRAEVQTRRTASCLPAIVGIAILIMEKTSAALSRDLRDCSEIRVNLFLDLAVLAALAVVEVGDLNKAGEKPQIVPLTSQN
jgi:hypothetical protein